MCTRSRHSPVVTVHRTPDTWQIPIADLSEAIGARKAHRRAAIGTSLRHSGHFFVVGSGGASPRRRRSFIMFIGVTTKT
jgi:hypothetical protein